MSSGDMTWKYLVIDADYVQAINAVADKEWIWIVDPLDGTTNYVYSLPLSVVSICVAHNVSPSFLSYKQEIPVIGVIFDPYRNEMFTAIKGHGAFMNGNRLHVRGDATLHESVIGFATNYIAYVRKAMMRGICAVSDHALSIRNVGSAALHLAWVAAGRLSGYFELALHPVDFGWAFQSSGMCRQGVCLYRRQEDVQEAREERTIIYVCLIRQLPMGRSMRK